MGVPERLAKLAGGRNIDFGARPSKEQERVMDRTHEALDAAKAGKRKHIRQQKQQARKAGTVYRHNPAPLAACRNTRSSGGGTDREETLAAMRGLDPTSTAYVMYERAQDRSSFPEALKGLTMIAVDLAIERGWNNRKNPKQKLYHTGKDILRSMVRLAICELSDPKCTKCHGAKCGRNGGLCRRCKGDGKMRISDKDRAIALDIAYHQYRDTYGRRYDAVMRMIKGIGRDAIQHIHVNLYGDKDWDTETI